MQKPKPESWIKPRKRWQKDTEAGIFLNAVIAIVLIFIVIGAGYYFIPAFREFFNDVILRRATIFDLLLILLYSSMYLVTHRKSQSC